MKQSRRASLAESITNTAAGLFLSLVLCRYLLPLFGFNAGWGDATLITLAFTILSVARNYAIRRLFVWRQG